jgi:hypothetical protein
MATQRNTAKSKYREKPHESTLIICALIQHYSLDAAPVGEKVTSMK